MVTLTIRDNNLILNIRGIGKLLALRSRLSVPIKNIRGVTADSGAFDLPKGIRSPGAAILGIRYTGTFHNKDGKVFWDVRNQAKAIVIELQNDSYKRLIVEVADPTAVVTLIERYFMYR